MNTYIIPALVLAVFLGISAPTFTQSPSAYSNVEQAIRDFATAGDQQDIKALEKILHPDHRVLLHQAFGAPGTTVWDKATYIEMAQKGKVGGETRKLAIVSLDVMDNVASSKVVMESSKMRFETRLLLVKSELGAWQVISDLPKITPLETTSN